MSSIRDFFKKKKKLDNKGEAMILMIVAIGIIMFLGLSLLYATATAFMIRNTERHSEETFNSADTGMDFIKNRLTEVESKAAEQGYAQVLNLYSESKSDQANFKKSFLDELGKIVVSKNGDILIKDTPDSSEATLFPGATSNAISSYSPDAVSYLLRANTASGDKCDLECSGNAQLSADKDAVTLKGIKLTYTRKDGYVTTVYTDIKLKVPDITVSTPAQGFERNALTGFSCVADQGLYLYDYEADNDINNREVSSKTGSIEGSIYAGSVYAREYPLTVTSGHKVVIGRTRATSEDGAGNVTVDKDDSHRTDGQLNLTKNNYYKFINTNPDYANSGITVEEGGELWTQDINLIYNASLLSSKGSSVMVADDLNFKDGGSATIEGNYIGFGNGENSDDSSSIVFNDSARKAKLDFSNAESLMLAGRSFILPNQTGQNEIGMGSSITAKGEQTAYLIPAGDNGILGSGMTNPQTVPARDAMTQKQKVIELVNSKLSDTVYNMNDPLSKYQPEVKVLSYPISGGNKYVQYYFFSFTSKAMANAYFKDFFNANKTKIQSYIDQYAEISGLKSSVSKTAGTGLTTDNGDISITDAVNDSTEMDNSAQKYQKKYKNLSETLDEKSSGDSTPFYSMIDIDNLHNTCVTRNNNNLVPVAWWADQNDYQAVYSDDSISDPHGGNVLIVANTLYYDKHNSNNYVMFIYENGTLSKLTLKKSGDSLDTNPGPGDKIVVQDGKNYVTRTYGGSTASADLANIVGIVSNKADNPSVGKAAGYVIWGDFDEKNFTTIGWGDTQINFIVEDGNVRIEHNFHGLIMCSGKLEVAGGKISLEDNIGSKILAKTHVWSANTGGTKSSSREDWTLGKMVVYENWKKN